MHYMGWELLSFSSFYSVQVLMVTGKPQKSGETKMELFKSKAMEEKVVVSKRDKGHG